MISLSYSACQKYLLSPFSYFAHYFLRLRPVDKGSALIFGSAVDEGLNSLLIDKKNNMPVDLEKAKRAFDKEFASESPLSIKYSKADADDSLLLEEDRIAMEQSAPEIPLAWFCLQRKGYMILEAYIEQVLPRIKEVLLVQHDISLTNDAGDTFTGKIDLICKWEDDKIYLTDNKTSSIKYAADAVSDSGQLATYYEAMRDMYKLSGALFIVIPKKVRKKKKPAIEIEFVFGEISEPLIEKTFQDYDNVLSGIKNGEFPCTREHRDGCCSAPWGCSYKSFCASGGKDLTGLTYEKKK